ncbi:hypothetical protein ACVILI_005283 [Mesorhizobium sp. USDA 4775]
MEWLFTTHYSLLPNSYSLIPQWSFFQASEFTQ